VPAAAGCPAAPYGARFYAPGSSKTVALTFDDGPGKSTAAILAILARYRVPATFFNIGVNMAPRPALVRAEVKGGYAMGNHTWNHRRDTPGAHLGRHRVPQRGRLAGPRIQPALRNPRGVEHLDHLPVPRLRADDRRARLVRLRAQADLREPDQRVREINPQAGRSATF